MYQVCRLGLFFSYCAFPLQSDLSLLFCDYELGRAGGDNVRTTATTTAVQQGKIAWAVGVGRCARTATRQPRYVALRCFYVLNCGCCMIVLTVGVLWGGTSPRSIFGVSRGLSRFRLYCVWDGVKGSADCRKWDAESFHSRHTRCRISDC